MAFVDATTDKFQPVKSIPITKQPVQSIKVTSTSATYLRLRAIVIRSSIIEVFKLQQKFMPHKTQNFDLK